MVSIDENILFFVRITIYINETDLINFVSAMFVKYNLSIKDVYFLVLQIEGNNAKADDAIMLDKDGYVSETNATNIVRLLFSLYSMY